MKAAVEYYISTLSVDQAAVRRATVRLISVGELPTWVRVYEYGAPRRTRLLRDLLPQRVEHDRCEYLDIAESVAGQSARIYLFSRR